MGDSYDVARKAREITSEIGCDLIKEGYYSDTCYGREYKYEDFRISTSNDSVIRIKIGNIQVFEYNWYTDDCVIFIQGKWEELLDMIYYDIPNILSKRKRRSEEEGNRISELQELIPYLKDLIKLYKKGIRVKEAIDSKLGIYDIRVEKRRKETSLGSYNYQSGELNTFTSNYIDIYYEGERVLECNDNSMNPIQIPSSLTQMFKPGIWTTFFKDVIDDIKDNYEDIISQELDDMTDGMLRRYR